MPKATTHPRQCAPSLAGCVSPARDSARGSPLRVCRSVTGRLTFPSISGSSGRWDGAGARPGSVLAVGVAPATTGRVSPPRSTPCHHVRALFPSGSRPLPWSPSPGPPARLPAPEPARSPCPGADRSWATRPTASGLPTVHSAGRLPRLPAQPRRCRRRGLRPRGLDQGQRALRQVPDAGAVPDQVQPERRRRGPRRELATGQGFTIGAVPTNNKYVEAIGTLPRQRRRSTRPSPPTATRARPCGPTRPP